MLCECISVNGQKSIVFGIEKSGDGSHLSPKIIDFLL